MKTLNGKVVSNKQVNTAIVEVTRRVPHKLYKKILTVTKKYQVDTAGKTVNVGDEVMIVETRPMSKTKYFKLVEEKK